MRLTLLLLLIFIPLLVSAEMIDCFFYGEEHNDSGRKILETEDGILTAGHTYSSGNGNADFYLVSTDLFGNLNWQHTYGGPGWDYAMDICQAVENDGYILVGYTTSSGSGDIDFLMVKTDLDGNEIWSQTFGGTSRDIATSVCYSSDGGYFICGYTESFGSGVDDVYLIKTSASGNELWFSTYGSIKSETAHDIKQTADGNLIIAGSTGIYDVPGGAGRNRDMYILKVDESGSVLFENEVWIITAAQGSYDICYSILESPEGGFYALGSSSQEGSEVMDISLLKLDDELNVEWKTVYEIDSIYDFGYSVGGFTADSCIYITGTYKSNQFFGNGIYFKKLDLSGNEVISEVYDLEGSVSAYDVIETQDNNFLLTGHKTIETGNKDLMIVHISGMQIDFDSSAETGFYPLEVQFEDRSVGSPISWAWDFNNDGTIDSSEPDPVFTYDEPGYYTVTLEVSDLYITKSITKENYVRTFDAESALEFNGTSSYVSVSSNESIDLTGALTMEAWIYPISWGETTAFGGRIVDKDSYGIYLCESHTSLTNQSLGVQLKTEGAPLSFSTSEENSILLQYWQHVAITYDGIDEVKIYINGIENDLTQLNPPSGGLLDNSNDDLVFGKSANLSWSFDGIIDEVRIWNLVRSEQEIQDNMGSLLTGTEAGLTAYWSMNEAWGEELTDQSINDNIGLIQNADWMQGTPFQFTDSDDNSILEISESFIASLSNYPNPFNPNTEIVFQLIGSAKTSLSIFNMKGQKIKTLINAVYPAGYHSVSWDGTDDQLRIVSSGIYFYKLDANGTSKSKKTILLK